MSRNQVDAVMRALDNIEDRYGNIDEFVAKELGIKANTLGDRFSGEQVDALAMAIHNHKTGNAFINGDQTGVGKGRQVAAMMQYAKRIGTEPVFMTEKPNLYSDMVRDLTDIGFNTEKKPFQPLVTNGLTGDDKIELPDGRILSQTTKAAKARFAEVLRNLRTGRGLKAKVKNKDVDYNAVFTTYNQMQSHKGNETWRRDAMRDMRGQAFFILDESHNAGGTADGGDAGDDHGQGTGDDKAPSRAELIRELLDGSPGAYYSSATFAKRAETMSLYFRTGIRRAVDNIKKLGPAIKAGGVPLQQVVSEMLAEAGQYLRRERSFDGVEFNNETVEVDLGIADKVSEVFRAIQEFDVAKETGVANVATTVVSAGGGMGNDTSTGQAGVDSANFTSIMHNIVDQQLVALKADVVADRAIAAWKAGETPVIAIDNTLEAALDEFLEKNPALAGEGIDFSFRDILHRYLERSREVMVKPDKNDKDTWYRHYMTDEELGDIGVIAYERTKALIERFDGKLPASPIDWIRYRLEKAGMSVAEITGRDRMIQYSGDPMSGTLALRPPKESGAQGRIATIKGVNDGSIDAVILNRSGATGVSMHASEKFKNQRKRHMIIAQAAKNIDEFMQMLGRIHRTGQVTTPKYTLLNTNAPAENRPAAVLAKKMASLNASVTASAKGAVGFEAPDMMNVVGDHVVAQYFNEHRDDHFAIGEPLQEKKGVLAPSEDVARKATGRVAMLPVESQERFWEEVTRLYYQRIDELDSMGANPLVAKTLPLDAQTLERFTIKDGQEDTTNPFEQPAYLERASVKVLAKPFTADEVTKKIADTIGSDPNANAILRKNSQWGRAFLDDVISKGTEYYREKVRSSKPEMADSLRDQFARQREVLTDVLGKMPPGTSVTVDTRDGALMGVVTGIRRVGKAKNPMAPSTIMLDVAVADAARKMSFAASSIFADEQVAPNYSQLTDSLSAFDEAQTTTREERFIGTGNLLAGYTDLQNANAQIVFFTDNSGQTRRGILMPKNFDAAKWEDARPVVFTKAKDVLRFLESGETLFTPDKNAWIASAGSNIVLKAQKARSRGGRYTTNQKLLDASSPHEFVSRGQIMEMVVPRRDAEKVLDAFLVISPLESTQNRELAKQILGESGGGGGKDKKTQVYKSRIDRKAVQAAFPGATLTPMPNKAGWNVELPSGAGFDVQLVERINVDWTAVESRLGKKFSAAERAELEAAGAFMANLADSVSVGGWGLMELSKQLADRGTVRHEALHVAKAMGLFTPSEWKALVDKHAKKGSSPAQQEEEIAEARAAWEGQDGLLAKIKAWLNKLLSSLGLAEVKAETVHQLLDDANFWSRKPSSMLKWTQYELRRKAARPDLANPGLSTPVRNLVDDVDEVRNDNGEPASVSDEDVLNEAAKRLKADPKGERKKFLKVGDSGGQLSDVETVIAKSIINEDATAAINSGDSAKLKDAFDLIYAWRKTGSEWGRAGRQRRDPVEPPAQRRARYLSEAILNPPEDIQKKIDKAEERGDKPTAEKHRDEWIEKVIKLIEELKKEYGLSDDDIIKRLSRDPIKSAEIVRRVAQLKATKWDALYEYWNNAILSGPTTHAANLTGMVFNDTIDTAERFVEAMVNSFVQRPEGAQIGEFKHYAAGIMPGLSQAFRNAVMSWRTEMSEFDRQNAMNLGKSPPEFEGNFAIKGLKGRIARTPWRGLRAADDFYKTLKANMEVGAQAYRIAKAEGFEGSDLAERIQDLHTDYSSDAWRSAVDKARFLSFQDQGGELSQKAHRFGTAARKLPGGRYILPFIQTPIRVFARGLDLSPLGSIRLARTIADNLSENRPALENATDQVARQMIGWGMALALYGLVGEDDDDTFITGAKSKEHRYSVRIGNTWYSYSRIEPLATTLGLLVDTIHAMKYGDTLTAVKEPFISLLAQTQEKTMLRGLADLFTIGQAALRGRSSGDSTELEHEIAQWAARFGSSWYPNLLKQIGSASTDQKPERSQWGGRDESQWYERLWRRTLQWAEFPGVTDLPEIDLWGRERDQSFSENPATDFLFRMTVPSRMAKDDAHPGDKFIANWNRIATDSNDKIGDQGLIPYYQKDGKKHSMADEQFHQAAKLSGQIADKLWEAGGYDAENPDAAQAADLKADFEKARKIAREALIKEWSGGPKATLNAEGVAAVIRRERALSASKVLKRERPTEKKKGDANMRETLDKYFKERQEAMGKLRRLGKASS